MNHLLQIACTNMHEFNINRNSTRPWSLIQLAFARANRAEHERKDFRVCVLIDTDLLFLAADSSDTGHTSPLLSTSDDDIALALTRVFAERIRRDVEAAPNQNRPSYLGIAPEHFGELLSLIQKEQVRFQQATSFVVEKNTTPDQLAEAFARVQANPTSDLSSVDEVFQKAADLFGFGVQPSAFDRSEMLLKFAVKLKDKTLFRLPTSQRQTQKTDNWPSDFSQEPERSIYNFWLKNLSAEEQRFTNASAIATDAKVLTAICILNARSFQSGVQFVLRTGTSRILRTCANVHLEMNDESNCYLPKLGIGDETKIKMSNFILSHFDYLADPIFWAPNVQGLYDQAEAGNTLRNLAALFEHETSPQSVNKSEESNYFYKAFARYSNEELSTSRIEAVESFFKVLKASASVASVQQVLFDESSQRAKKTREALNDLEANSNLADSGAHYFLTWATGLKMNAALSFVIGLISEITNQPRHAVASTRDAPLVDYGTGFDDSKKFRDAIVMHMRTQSAGNKPAMQTLRSAGEKALMEDSSGYTMALAASDALAQSGNRLAAMALAEFSIGRSDSIERGVSRKAEEILGEEARLLLSALRRQVAQSEEELVSQIKMLKEYLAKNEDGISQNDAIRIVIEIQSLTVARLWLLSTELLFNTDRNLDCAQSWESIVVICRGLAPSFSRELQQFLSTSSGSDEMFATNQLRVTTNFISMVVLEVLSKAGGNVGGAVSQSRHTPNRIQALMILKQQLQNFSKERHRLSRAVAWAGDAILAPKDSSLNDPKSRTKILDTLEEWILMTEKLATQGETATYDANRLKLVKKLVATKVSVKPAAV
jgi:hypothetical protein